VQTSNFKCLKTRSTIRTQFLSSNLKSFSNFSSHSSAPFHRGCDICFSSSGVCGKNCTLYWKQGIPKGQYHCTIDLVFNWFGLVSFAHKNKNCQLSYSWFQTSQTGGGQCYSDTSPSSIPYTSISNKLFLFTFFRSACSRWSLTSFEPFLDTIAISEVGSLMGMTGSCCFVKTMRPSRNGGMMLFTIKWTLASLTSSKSSSKSVL